MSLLTRCRVLHWAKDDLVQNYNVLCVNSSPSGQNGLYFADGIFEHIFLNENETEICSRRQGIPWTNTDPVRWYIYAAQGGD